MRDCRQRQCLDAPCDLACRPGEVLCNVTNGSGGAAQLLIHAGQCAKGVGELIGARDHHVVIELFRGDIVANLTRKR
jgi:hypothetical protein